MSGDYEQALATHVNEALKAIASMRESNIAPLPSYYAYVERELTSFQSVSKVGTNGQQQAAAQAREMAAQLIRTVTDYIADDKHPLVAALLRLQAQAQTT